MYEQIKIVYENERIINKIYEVSDRIRGRVVDQTKFESRCINAVGKYLMGGNDRAKNFRYIKDMIIKEATAALERNKKEMAEVFSTLSTEGEDGEEIDFEPVDVLADVESEVMAKETATLLAEDDCKRKMVLQSWADGNDNTTLVSRMLAHTYGGNASAHRKFIQRFRTGCREKLQAAI